jgi:ankyrin repeat protein
LNVTKVSFYSEQNTILVSVCGHLKVLDVLIQNKANLSTADSHVAYPIHYAAQMNGANSGNTESRISEKVLKKFLEAKVQLDVEDDAGRQPLLWAACSGRIYLS